MPVWSVQFAPESVEVIAALRRLEEEETATNVVPLAQIATQLFALAAAIVVFVTAALPFVVRDVLTELVVETITKLVPSHATPRLVELASTAPVVQDVASVEYIETVLDPDTA